MKYLRILFFVGIVFVGVIFLNVNLEDLEERTEIPISEKVEMVDFENIYIEVITPYEKHTISEAERVMTVYDFIDSMIWDLNEGLIADTEVIIKSNIDTSYEKTYGILVEEGVLHLIDNENGISSKFSLEDSSEIISALGI